MSSLPPKQQPFPSNSTAPEPSESVSGKRKSQTSDVEGEGPCKKNHNSLPERVDSSGTYKTKFKVGDTLMSTSEVIDWLNSPVSSEEEDNVKSITTPEPGKDILCNIFRMSNSLRILKHKLDEEKKEVEKWKSKAAKLDSEYKEFKAAHQKENEELRASFKRQTMVMHKLRDSLSLEQSQVGILLEKIKKLQTKKEDLIDEYRTSEEFGHEVLFFAHSYAHSAHSVGYAEALKEAKEKYPSLELSEFPLFNPNAEEESQLKILIDEVGWRPCGNRAAPLADNGEASGSKPAEDKH